MVPSLCYYFPDPLQPALFVQTGREAAEDGDGERVVRLNGRLELSSTAGGRARLEAAIPISRGATP